jgi:hypothetical protein
MTFFLAERLGTRNILLTLGVVLIPTVCSTPHPAAAQQQVPLPEVTVTAPPITPSWKKFTPYFGNPRVEEDKWPDIPCAASRVGFGTPSRCKTGTAQETRTPVLPGIQQSNCRIAHDLVMTNVGNLAIEADVMVFDPYYVSAIGHQHGSCYVEAGYGDLREDFPDINQTARQGNGWRNFIANGDLSTMEFSVGAADCLALEKRGPRWGGGYVYAIHASICRSDQHPLAATDVDYVLRSLQIRQFEPRGNLASPPR